jgi:hypothetical protein
MNLYSASELEKLPTLSVGQADDLKVDTGNIRIWLSRCGIADGAPYKNQVTIEKLTDGRWETLDTYEG